MHILFFTYRSVRIGLCGHTILCSILRRLVIAPYVGCPKEGRLVYFLIEVTPFVMLTNDF